MSDEVYALAKTSTAISRYEKHVSNPSVPNLSYLFRRNHDMRSGCVRWVFQTPSTFTRSLASRTRFLVSFTYESIAYSVLTEPHSGGEAQARRSQRDIRTRDDGGAGGRRGQRLQPQDIRGPEEARSDLGFPRPVLCFVLLLPCISVLLLF